MARRPGGGDDDISLFPFLSIIACVIGVLTLMIATVSMAQMNTSDVKLIIAYEDTMNQLTKDQQKLLELKKQLDEKIGPAAAKSRDEMEASEKELEQLMKELERVHEELLKQQKIKVVIPTLDPALRESLSSMQQELKGLQEELAQMEKELEGRKDAPPVNVSILPSGSGINFTPHFVECADGAIVLHDLNPPKTIRAGDMVTDKDFIKILEQVANSVNDTVIFLIRSEGLNTFYAAKKLCDDRNIRNGKLPVIGQGKIDLSHFTRQK